MPDMPMAATYVLEAWRGLPLNADMATKEGSGDRNGRAGGAQSNGANSAAMSMERLIVAVGENRDRQAFSAVFAHFAPRIKAYLMRTGCEAGAAEEVVQEAMVALWRRADRFDPAQANASTWVFTIARNKRIDMLRRERRPEVDPEDPALVRDPEVPADRTIESAQESDRVRSAVAALPAEQGDLLRMAYYEDKAHSVIAQEKGLPLGTVKSRIRLAMARLRKSLSEG